MASASADPPPTVAATAAAAAADDSGVTADSSSASAAASASPASPPSLVERYEASFLLAACGDAMGYMHGRWEFNHSAVSIHADMLSVTKGKGVLAVRVGLPSFPLSDDTLMTIATAEGFLETALDLPQSLRPADCTKDSPLSFHNRCALISQAYIRSFEDMDGRAPGGTTGASIHFVERAGVANWHTLPFSKSHGGCGASMRSTPLGLVFPLPSQLQSLVAYAVESGRMTHHSPLGYCGAVAGGVFTSYALQDLPPEQWGKRLVEEVIPLVEEHLKARNVAVEDNLGQMHGFVSRWKAYLKLRGISDGVGPAVFPAEYGVKERDEAYTALSLTGWAGATGVDAPMIAYDAFLSCGGSWEEACLRGVLHGGDNDSTGVLLGGWFGAAYGFRGVPESHYRKLEYHDRMVGLAKQLCERYGEGKHAAHEGEVERIGGAAAVAAAQ